MNRQPILFALSTCRISGATASGTEFAALTPCVAIHGAPPGALPVS